MSLTIVCMLAGLAVAVACLAVVNYRPVGSAARLELAGTEIHHFTTADTGALIDNGDGTVTVAATRTRGWRAAQVAHMVWSRIPATYVYTGLPTRWEKRLHHNQPPQVVVRITGADLLEGHPGVIYRSLGGNALALPNGYTGPGTVTPLTSWAEIRR